MALFNPNAFKQKLSATLPVTTPAPVVKSGGNISPLDVFSSGVSVSTPQVYMKPTDGKASGLFDLLDPRKPVEVRPFIASEQEKVTLPYGGVATGLVHDIAARTLEFPIKATAQALSNFRMLFNPSDPEKAKLTLPFDQTRVGFSPGESVEDSGQRYNKAIEETGFLQDPSPTNLVKAVGATFMTAGMDALDALVAGDLFKATARAGLNATRYSPELDKALQQLGVKGTEIDIDTLKATFEQKARQLVKNGDQKGWDELGRATNTVVEHLTGRGIPQLNRFGQLVQDASRLALQDAKYGLKLRHPLFPEIAPKRPVESLPGYVSMESNAVPIGLRTEKVRKVGGEESYPQDIPTKQGEIKPVVRQPNVPERAVAITPEVEAPLLEAVRSGVTKAFQGSEEQLAYMEKEVLQLKRALADDGAVPIYLPREQGVVLEPGAEVRIFKPWSDNVLTQGPLAHRFTANARDLLVDPESGKVYYNSPEPQSAVRGEPNEPFYLGIGDEKTMLINKEFPEGIEVDAFLQKVQTEAKNKFTKEQIEDMRGMFGAMRDAIMLHPGRRLAKYANKEGKLPEVTGKGPGKFSQEGDVIAQEAGYETSEEARDDYQEYKKQLQNYKDAQEQLRTNVRAARDFNALDRARQQLLSSYRSVERSVETSRLKSIQAGIRRELIQARPTVGKDNVRRGKYTPAIQKKIEAVDSAVHADREKAIGKALKNVQAHSGAEGTMQAMPEEVIAENELLGMAGALTPKGAKEIGREGLEKILENIRQLKETGQTLRELKLANKREELDRVRNAYLKVVSGGQGLKPGTGLVPEAEATWWGTLLSPIRNYLDAHRGLDFQLEYLSRFDPTSQPLDSILHRVTGEQVHKARNARNKGIREWTEKYQNKFGTIFKVKPGTKDFRKEIQKQLVRKKITDITDPATGKSVPLEMNRFELRKKWMELKDQSLRATFELTMGWDSRVIQAVKNAMTPEDVAFATWQLKEFYPEYRKSINPIYEDMYGISMGNIPNYSPIKRAVQENIPEYVQEINAIQRASVKPGSIKSRTQNIAPLEYVGDMQILQQHIIEMEHFKAYAQVIADIRRTFTGPLKTGIQQYHGKEIMRNFEKMIDDLARDGIDWRNRFDFLDTARGNFAVSAMGLNPSIMLKQLTSVPAYLTEMPVLPWTRYSAEFWLNPLKNAKELLDKSDHLKSRYDLGSFDRDVKLAFSRGANAAKLSGTAGFKEQFMAMIMLGDKGAVLAGGWPVYKYNLERLLAEGLPREQAEKKAIEIFERATKRTQQAGDVEDLGALQRSGSIGNLFTLFMTTPIQYWRITEAAARNLGLFERFGGSTKRGSRWANLKKIFIMWVVLPMLFQFVSDGFSFNKKRQTRAAVLGPLGYPVILGDLFDTLARKLSGDDVFQDSYTPAAITSILNAGKSIADSFVLLDKSTTAEDIQEVVEELAIVAGNLTGIPVKQPLNTTKGAYELATGETTDIRKLIFSDYALDEKNTKKKPVGTSDSTSGALNSLNRLNTLSPNRLQPSGLERLNSLNKLNF